MNRLIIALVISAHFGVAHAADFRDASWGMTLNEVKALHRGEIAADQRSRSIAFDGKLAGLDVLIFYRFDERGGLFKAGYETTTEHVDQNLFVEDYLKLNRLLRRKYPQSADPIQTWSNRLFESKPGQWGRAVALGHLSYQWSHSAPKTKILHSLTGDRRDIIHRLSYEAVSDQTEQDALEQL